MSASTARRRRRHGQVAQTVLQSFIPEQFGPADDRPAYSVSRRAVVGFNLWAAGIVSGGNASMSFANWLKATGKTVGAPKGL
jgi:hypothetical protein